MGIIISRCGITLFLKKIIESISKHFLLRMFFFFILVNIVWLIRFPFIYKKIYAEDGKLFLNEAFEFTFPLDLLQPAAGYSQLIQRIGGNVVHVLALLEISGLSGRQKINETYPQIPITSFLVS